MIVLASNNSGKVAEFRRLFSQYSIPIIPQSQLAIDAVEETGLTFVENALLKARHVAKISKKPTIADDSGLVVPALGGAPGIYSARYSGVHGDDAKNNTKLLQALHNITERQAMFVCVIVFMRTADDPLPIIAQGFLHGEISTHPCGKKGFGYDPIFYLPKYHKTVAELSLEDKLKISHRSQAVTEFFQQFQKQNFIRHD